MLWINQIFELLDYKMRIWQFLGEVFPCVIFWSSKRLRWQKFLPICAEKVRHDAEEHNKDVKKGCILQEKNESDTAIRRALNDLQDDVFCEHFILPPEKVIIFFSAFGCYLIILFTLRNFSHTPPLHTNLRSLFYVWRRRNHASWVSNITECQFTLVEDIWRYGRGLFIWPDSLFTCMMLENECNHYYCICVIKNLVRFCPFSLRFLICCGGCL